MCRLTSGQQLLITVKMSQPKPQLHEDEKGTNIIEFVKIVVISYIMHHFMRSEYL